MNFVNELDVAEISVRSQPFGEDRVVLQVLLREL